MASKTGNWQDKVSEGMKLRINSFAELRPDWDSYGGDPPTKEAMDTANYLLDGLFIAPLPTGGISITLGADEDVCIEIAPDGTWLVEDISNETNCIKLVPHPPSGCY